jgi:SnoaL-like domain
MVQGHVRRDILRIAAVSGAAVPLVMAGSASPAFADDGDAEIGRLHDIEAIKQLKARYFRALDLRLWDLFGSVWTADAHLEQSLTGDVVDGRDAIVEFVRSSLSPFQSVHHGHMPEITIIGGSTAHGIWAMFGLIAVPGTQPAKGFTDYGHYTEDYAKQADVWQISSSRLDVLRIDPLPGGFPGS